jgi:hypothetical protein
MICPGVAHDCDNPGCRHGGCQGRPPQRPRNAMAAPVPDSFARNRSEQPPRTLVFEARRSVEPPRPSAVAH